jgi:hypothetical protein
MRGGLLSKVTCTSALELRYGYSPGEDLFAFARSQAEIGTFAFSGLWSRYNCGPAVHLEPQYSLISV